MPLFKKRAMEIISRAGIDAVVGTSPANVYYMTDYNSLAMELSSGLQSYALLPLDGDPAIIAPLNEVDLVTESDSWVKDIYYFGALNINVAKGAKVTDVTKRIIESTSHETYDTPCDGLTIAVTKRGLSKKKIAVDLNNLSPLRWEQMHRNLPDVNFVDGTELLNEIRAVKTPEEVERIQRATEITEKAMEDALEIAQPEIMEIDLAGMFNYSITEDGGHVTLDHIGFGERSAYPNPVPTTLKSKKGDLIRFNLGASWGHYNGNVTRTAALGQASPEAEKRLTAVVDAQEAAFDVIKPGVPISEIYVAAEKELAKIGVKEYSANLGHSIGIECNEHPLVTKGMGFNIEEGMVLNIDIPYLELGWGGIELEDTLLVTKKGFKLLTNTERTVYLL
jgi:Xaa-Pro dipeptidase